MSKSGSSSGGGGDDQKKNFPRVIFYQSNKSTDPKNQTKTEFGYEPDKSEHWTITTKKALKQLEEKDVPDDLQLLEELEREATIATQNIRELFKRVFEDTKREKNETEFNKKVFVSAMAKYRVEFRAFYAQLVNHLRHNGYNGPILEFPTIDIKTIVADAMKTHTEKNPEDLVKPVEKLSLNQGRSDAGVMEDSGATGDRKYEWKASPTSSACTSASCSNSRAMGHSYSSPGRKYELKSANQYKPETRTLDSYFNQYPKYEAKWTNDMFYKGASGGSCSTRDTSPSSFPGWQWKKKSAESGSVPPSTTDHSYFEHDTRCESKGTANSGQDEDLDQPRDVDDKNPPKDEWNYNDDEDWTDMN